MYRKDTMSTFKELPLSQEMLQVIDKLGFTVPTEIQVQAIPHLLTPQKIDFHGQAQTGTGKTLAFGIPIFERIDKSHKETQVIIVAPTRELANQIYESLHKMASYMNVSTAVIYGGMSIDDQIRKLKRGVQVVVGTPGRLNDHLRRKTLDPRLIKTLVLDEADIMLDMGFKEEIEEIIKRLPSQRQIWLFSATVKAGIADIMKKHMQDTVSVRISASAVATAKTKQFYCIVPFRSRMHAVTRFIQSVGDFYGFIFCQTKLLASDVADELMKRGYNVAALHGDLSQQHRNRVIKKFRQRQTTILVATDVAARGIDIPNITHVINYTVPEDLESYVHRVGRTGRAGQEGIAITFISKSEQRIIKHIERKFSTKILPIDVPSPDVVIQKRLDEIPHYIQESQKSVPQEAALKKIIDTMAPHELKQVALHLLYDLFLSKLDLDEIPYTHVDDEDQFQEIYIDAGADDGVTQKDVRDYLMKTSVIKPDQIKKIRVIKRRSYIKLSSDCSPDLVQSLRGKRLNGRKVRVQVTCMINDRGFRGRDQQRGKYRSKKRRSDTRRKK